jgi:chromosome segregation ATPase
MVAAPAAVLAGLGYGGYKLATRKKEKEYSEGFEDGYDFAIQRLFSKYRDNNPLQASVDDAWAQYGKQIKEEAKAKAEDEAAKAAKKAANSMQESIDDAWGDYGKKVNQEDHIKSLSENLHKADANAKYYEDLYKKGQITKAELEKQLASSKSTISGLNTRVGNLQGSLDKALKGQDRLSNDLRKSESGRKMVEKSLRNWKIGTGIGAGITAAGIGAYALRNRKKNRD